MARVLIVGVFTLVIMTLFIRQIFNQLRSGKVRPRGSTNYKTRQNNPVWYWTSIGVQIAAVLLFLYVFSQTFLKASK